MLGYFVERGVLMRVTEYRAVVYVCGVAFEKVLEWTHGEEPRVGEPCILRFGHQTYEVRSENVISQERNPPDHLTTCFFQLEDEFLFYYLCEPFQRDGWSELDQR